MLMNLNGVDSVYETDRLLPIVQIIREQMIGKTDEAVVRDCRIMADHLRAAGLILAEGVAPANTGRGYIPRRLIRKCVATVKRRALTAFRWADVLNVAIEVMGRQYPHLAANRARILEVVEAENRAFSIRINEGFERLAVLAKQRPFRLSGSDALSLFATFGLPMSIISDFVRDHGGEVDEAGFQEAFKHHQDVSRAG